ncbi:hypothetical protein IG631_11448 [Alternaria alternata]|nr:hypothetical protein IG631_11448 [Alternaria alternata]
MLWIQRCTGAGPASTTQHLSKAVVSNYINSEYVATTYCMTKLVAASLGVGFAACMPTSSTPNHGLVRPSFKELISMHLAHVQIPQGSPVAGQN